MRRWRGFPIVLASVVAAVACGGPPGPEPLANGSFDLDLGGGARLRYAIHGQGPTLMTLPNSWGLSHEGLRALYRPLEQRLTLVYFDPRGIGGSSAAVEEADLGAARVREDFDALRRHLGIERANVIGWSNGAMNLQLLASERPDTIGAAIFVHGVARFEEADMAAIVAAHPEMVAAYGEFMAMLSDPALDDAGRDARTKTFNLEVALPPMFADPESGRRVLPTAFRDAAFSWRHARYSQQEWPTFDARDRLGAIRARSLVLAGAHDMLPPERAKEIADGIAGATFVVFEHSGHFAQLEEPQAFVETVAGFVESEGP